MVILALGKARSHRAPNLGYRGAEWPGWFDVSPKNCMRHDTWVVMLTWWGCQSPAAHSCVLLNHLNNFHRGMFKLNAKYDADLLLYSLSHFECNNHTSQMLTQEYLLPPLTSTVRLPLFTHEHSSPLSLAARLHVCHTNHSCYISNGWTFSRQTSLSWASIAQIKTAEKPKSYLNNQEVFPFRKKYILNLIETLNFHLSYVCQKNLF